MFVNLSSHDDTATKFRVTPGLVHRLVKAYKKDSGFVESLQNREEVRKSKVANVEKATNEILATAKNVWRRAQIVDHVKQKYDMKVSKELVSQVLRHRLHMRYRKVKRIPFQGNSERCLVLRQ